ncbi:MAG: energy-coupling factor transporter ATPase [Eubacteriales bacterium]
MATAIEIQNVSYVYGDHTAFCKVAVDNVSFSIEEGLITGMIGHTGSGKSTLVQMFNGLLIPTSGRVLLFGEELGTDKKKLKDARNTVGLVFQYPEYQLFEETVAKDIAFGPKNQGLSEDEIKIRVREAAAFVGLAPGIMDKSPFDLSGGQKRRVAIAGIIAMRPRVLVLDEPASGLDPIGREEIFGGLLRYKKETGGTVVIVSHSMEDMARYADRVIVLNQGKCVLSDTKEEIFRHGKELSSMGLDVPQITRFISRLREKGYGLPDNIYTVEDAAKVLLPLLKGANGPC